MTHNRITQVGNSLSQVHSVTQDGSGYIGLFTHIRHTDKGLYTALLGPDFEGFGFDERKSTECTANVDVADYLEIGTPSATENDIMRESENGQTEVLAR